MNKKILMFNTTGERNSENMLNELMKCNFDIVLFVPNVARAKKNAGNKQYTYLFLKTKE